MMFVKTPLMTYSMGNRIYYCENVDRYVLCNTSTEVAVVMSALGLPFEETKQVASLDETTIIKHLYGERVTVYHRGAQYECDTLFALGVPIGIDTTKPSTFVYRRVANDNA